MELWNIAKPFSGLKARTWSGHFVFLVYSHYSTVPLFHYSNFSLIYLLYLYIFEIMLQYLFC